MSQENVERTLLVYDAWNRRDPEAVISLIDPEVVWFPAVEGNTEGDAYIAVMPVGVSTSRTWRNGAPEGRLEVAEMHALGDQVLGLGRLWLGFASGVDLDSELASLSTWRDGKCIEARSWLSHAEALEAAGLSE